MVARGCGLDGRRRRLLGWRLRGLFVVLLGDEKLLVESDVLQLDSTLLFCLPLLLQEYLLVESEVQLSLLSLLLIYLAFSEVLTLENASRMRGIRRRRHESVHEIIRGVRMRGELLLTVISQTSGG